MRTSRVTGVSQIPSHSGLLGTESMMLLDGAQAVPVYGRWDIQSLTLLRTDSGVQWQTFCCTGPAAPLPAAVRRQVRVETLATVYMVTVEHKGKLFQLAHRVFFEAYQQMGEGYFWPSVMDELAHYLDALDADG